MEEILVSTKSNPKSVAGAITGMVRSGKDKVEIKVIGAGALNQGIKAIAIARGFLAPLGIQLETRPAFSDVKVNSGNKSEEERTGLRLIVTAVR